MVEFIVTVIDTVGIQDFIFGSNKLKQNVGASELVNYVTHEMVYQELVEIGETNIEKRNIYRCSLERTLSKKTIKEYNLNSELVYAGGGNAVILFKNCELAEKFTKSYSRKALLKAPGLQLAITHKKFVWEDNDLKDKVKETIHKVKQKKFDLTFSSQLLGLGVTADCQYTGLPASKVEKLDDTFVRISSEVQYTGLPASKVEKLDDTFVRISSEVSAKLKFFDDIKYKIRRRFLDFETKKIVTEKLSTHEKINVDFIYDFNDLGTKNKSSYMAVVHIDGNEMGKRIAKFSNEHDGSNREYINSIRSFSDSIEKNSMNALKATIKKLIESSNYKDGKLKIGEDVEIKRVKDRTEKDTLFLPFRPIVVGGDDITFVCDGRLGLTLAELFIRHLTSEKLWGDEPPISSRAGIAIVKSHFPFYQSVKISYDLAESAKHYIKDRKEQGEENVSALDWHFASSGVIENIENLRKREYTAKWADGSRIHDGNLIMRPLRIGKTVNNDWHSWETFEGAVNKFQDQNWSDKRNKLMRLRKNLRMGPIAVENLINIYKFSFPAGYKLLPEIPNHSVSHNVGWVDYCGRYCCTCFDAIEALEYFTPLKGGGK